MWVYPLPPCSCFKRFKLTILLICAACTQLSSPATYQFPLPPEPATSSLVAGTALPPMPVAGPPTSLSARQRLAHTALARSTAAPAERKLPTPESSLENPRSAQEGHNTPVSFDFKDADVRNVLRLLAEVSGKEIVATDDVHGRITIKLDNLPWDEALEVIAKTLDLNVERLGNVVRITSAARAESDEETRERAEALRTELFRLRFARAADVAALLAGERTHLSLDAGTGSLMEGFPDETGANVPYGSPAREAAAAKLTARPRVSLLSQRGSAMADEPSNTLIVTDVRRGLAAARQVINAIDRPAPQVEIESRIVETTEQYDRAMGIQWGYSYAASSLTGNPTGLNFPGSVTFGGGLGSGLNGGVNPVTGALIPFIADFPAGGGLTPGHGSALDLTLGSLNQSQLLDLRLTQLEDAQKVKIISRPRIITRNNQQAVIKSVDILRVRLPGSTIFGGYGLGVAFQSIEVGVMLKVRPQVSADGFILLDLQAVSSALEPNQQVDNIPVESERATESHVLLRDGQTLVVGGIYRLQQTVQNQGLPFLQTIPGLGWLFGEAERHDTRTDLVIFVTPHRIGPDPALAAGTLPTGGQLWLNRSASGG